MQISNTPRFRKVLNENGYWHWQDSASRKARRRGSLGTKNEAEADRLVRNLNEAQAIPSLSIHVARAYHHASDPHALIRTWQVVMDEILRLKRGDTHYRWMIAMRDEHLDSIRNLQLTRTRPEHFIRVLQRGTVSTNAFLRRLHNFALDSNWLLQPVMLKRQWPKVKHPAKRAITLDEHQRIIAREHNRERKAFYELCWHLGASQGDIASLHAEDVDPRQATVGYFRKKTGEAALVHFGEGVTRILAGLPNSGPLFPYLSTVRPGDRATEFKQRCDGLGIEGVTLHSYRYAWAQRAKECGYPERFAQQALGHNSKAVHRYYARTAIVKVPSLEDYEKQAELRA